MIYIGLDPSFASTGVVIWDSDNPKVINNFTIHRDSNPNKGFEQIVQDVDDVCLKLFDRLEEETKDNLWCTPVKVITECPPSTGTFASGLYALDVNLVLRLQSYGVPVYRVYPTFVGHIHGTRKYKKSESVELAKKIAGVLCLKFTNARVDQHQAEAMMFLTRLLCRDFNLEKFTTMYPAFKDEKELLIPRKEHKC